MGEYYENIYRTDSTRLAWHNYASPGVYYVTICTEYRYECFGEIRNRKMRLNRFGEVAAKFWKELPKHHKNVDLGEYVIMPNHLHGVIFLNIPEGVPVDKNMNDTQGKCRDVALQRLCGLPEQQAESQWMSNISPKSGSLSVIVRSFKSAVTNRIRQNGDPEFAWQGRFWERVIRTNREFDSISQYITGNPQNWEKDEYHPNDRK